MRRFIALALVGVVVVPATRLVAATSRSALRVALTAKNHEPRPSESPNWHWWYCVRVRTAGGKLVASPIRLLLRIVSGRRAVEGVGLVTFRKGFGPHDWCGAIGGEGNVLDAAPRGKKLDFRAVVRTRGVTVERDWPIVVR